MLLGTNIRLFYKMFCQYCLSSDPPSSLVSMHSKYFDFNGQQISYLHCFTRIKQVNIEDEQNAKICTNCMSILREKFALKQLETEKSNYEVSIKEEPELNLDSWSIPDDDKSSTNSVVEHYQLTSRVLSAEVVKYFHYDKEFNKTKCLVSKCGKQLSGKVLGNMKRHLIAMHKEEAIKLNLIVETTMPSSVTALPNCLEGNSSDSFSISMPSMNCSAKRIKIEFDEDRMIKGCLMAVTEEHLPYTFFNSTAFKMLTDPVTTALGITIDAANMQVKVLTAADKVRIFISDELRFRLFSLKIDSATRLGLSILIVHAQFLDDSDMQTRTLGVIQLNRSLTVEHLKTNIENILEKYKLSLVQVHAITIDSGVNMVKSTIMLEESREEILEILENQDFEMVPVADDHRDEKNLEKLLEMGSENQLHCVRCATHTLYSFAAAITKMYSTEIASVRNLAKQMKAQKYGKTLVDVQNRWMSSYLMIDNIQQNILFYKQVNADLDVDVYIADEIFEFISKFSTAFQPVFLATQKLQDQCLTIGDFYKVWLECKMECGEVSKDKSNIYAAIIAEKMESRPSRLFENEVFCAAIYMDFRFNFLGSNILSAENKRAAKDHIFKTWCRLKKIQPEERQTNETSTSSSVFPGKSALDAFIESNCCALSENEQNEEKHDSEIQQKILNLCNRSKLPSATNILNYWELLKMDEPELYAIAQVVLAVPPTQVTMEKAFSALNLLFTNLRSKLSTDGLDDLFVLKLNGDVLNKIDLK